MITGTIPKDLYLNPSTSYNFSYVNWSVGGGGEEMKRSFYVYVL